MRLRHWHEMGSDQYRGQTSINVSIGTLISSLRETEKNSDGTRVRETDGWHQFPNNLNPSIAPCVISNINAMQQTSYMK
jgi:hypothetical protein